MDDDQLRQLQERWHRAGDPHSLLEIYHLVLPATQPGDPPPAAARKWRLAAAACGRALWPLLAEAEEARRAVEVAES